jgi:hypothetical protein
MRQGLTDRLRGGSEKMGPELIWRTPRKPGLRGKRWGQKRAEDLIGSAPRSTTGAEARGRLDWERARATWGGRQARRPAASRKLEDSSRTRLMPCHRGRRNGRIDEDNPDNRPLLASTSTDNVLFATIGRGQAGEVGLGRYASGRSKADQTIRFQEHDSARWRSWEAGTYYMVVVLFSGPVACLPLRDRGC